MYTNSMEDEFSVLSACTLRHTVSLNVPSNYNESLSTTWKIYSRTIIVAGKLWNYSTIGIIGTHTK